jgi:centrosomal protein CEP41
MSVRSESVKSIITTKPNQLSTCNEETKFILLDLREEEDYNQFHIKEALNFPAPNISRDKTFSQLLRFKNNPDKIIVVYMSDERLGTQYSKILFEKGFDNIYLLTGGLEKFMEAGIDCYNLVEGVKVPP